MLLVMLSQRIFRRAIVCALGSWISTHENVS